ncbi:MAG: M12 family metallo-peptidase [Acidobacteriota bacterium]
MRQGTRSAVLLVSLSVLMLPAVAAPEAGLWRDVPGAPAVVPGGGAPLPGRYRLVALDEDLLAERLAAAPMEGTGEPGTTLDLPLPGGGFGRFRVEESPILAPALGARYPEIRTFAGRGIDDPAATLRADRSPAGFHAIVLSSAGTLYVDPLRGGAPGEHISYWKRDARSPREGAYPCPVEGEPVATEAAIEASSGKLLRTYRLAVAATGEYTAFHGGTVPLALAAVTTAINRVNAVYERDVAIRMELVADNDQILYTNPNTDPYTNNNGFVMLSQNQGNLDSVIGSANYDIGHVFSTGGGGIAGLGVACGSGKAQGVTGLPAPIGDPFYIDYVAHEMGHQWGAAHTFNGNAGSCSGNRSPSSAYEPGSASTIMGYAGICGSQDLQDHSDDYFHVRSFDQIVIYTVDGTGNSCAAQTVTGNLPPVVDAGPDHVIPLGTPFVLCGSAVDVEDQAALTYAWEQYNLGPAGPPGAPSGDAPIFRSFLPTSSPCRTFPQLSDLQENVQTIGELLPSYGRTLTFRLTVRDNRPGGGGADHDTADVVVDAGSGPFQVTAPNTATAWVSGTDELVTWDVANTDLPPVDCPTVDILLSTDRGASFPEVLAADTPNDGSETVTVPGVTTDLARVRVACSDGIFFDISDEDFAVGEPPPPPAGAVPDGMFIPGAQLLVEPAGGGDITLSWGSSCRGDDGDYAIYEGALGDFTSHTPRTCSTGDVLTETLTPASGSAYYLVVPRSASREGGYGFDGDGLSRPPSPAACAPQLVGVCDL